MNDKQKWLNLILESPTWLKAIIGTLTVVISFAILIQNNFYLGVTISVGLLLIGVFLSSLYFIYAKTPPLIEGGKGVYRYEKLRPWAIIVAILVIVTTIASIRLDPSRKFINIALLGTPTPLPTPTSTPLPQGLRVVDVLVYDENGLNGPYVDIKLRNVSTEIAILKRALFTVQNEGFGICNSFPPTPGPLLQSWAYDIEISESTTSPISKPISQQLGPNEADRFVFKFGTEGGYYYQSYPRFTLHKINIKLIYDEDNKVLDVGNIAFTIAPGGIVLPVFFGFPAATPSPFEDADCFNAQIEAAKKILNGSTKSEQAQILDDYIANLK